MEGRGEADGAEHPQLVLGKPLVRIANGPQDVVLQIFLAADIVVVLVGNGIEENAVDGEVAALGILLGTGEGDRVRSAAVGIANVAAEGGNFNLSGFFGAQDGDHAK